MAKWFTFNCKQVRRPSSSGGGSGGYAPGMMGGSQYAPGSVGAGPAPTTKPPTPPQAVRYGSGGTLNRGSKEYRTPPAVNPPQVPSNYAPNYPRQGSNPPGAGGKQYGTLPQVQVWPPAQYFLFAFCKKTSIRSMTSHGGRILFSCVPFSNSRFLVRYPGRSL